MRTMTRSGDAGDATWWPGRLLGRPHHVFAVHRGGADALVFGPRSGRMVAACSGSASSHDAVERRQRAAVILCVLIGVQTVYYVAPSVPSPPLALDRRLAGSR